MLIKTEEYEIEVFEISESQKDKIPSNFVAPYFVIADSMDDITVSFQFLTRTNILRKSGKRRYFDRDLNNAERFFDIEHAINVVWKFEDNQIYPGQKFYVSGSEQAEIIHEMNIINHNKVLDQFGFKKKK
ncbi:hypothetical protein [Abyssalbus ytuae]|uniref:Uncharacterized protein n=1 Tax=Abyssalbus ytuae TaxID=2926907 RepID=A0A9E7A3S8_9FLAO|nr:hypothetical protein [Abyssalbus ytuae]UOB19356.1 hypothetical protein MQE35_08665 [Abyssalbus ytuae]